jgi:hypothetical protein
MKKISLFSFLLLPTLVYSQSVKTLSCVDSSDPKYQMVVKFNDQTRKIIDLPSNAFDESVTSEIISYKTTVDNNVYTTIIYRSTGRFTVFTKIKGQDISFSGICSAVAKNKF